MVNAKVAEANAELTGKVSGLEADMQKIADALVDDTLTAEETTTAIGEVVGETPVNAPTA